MAFGFFDPPQTKAQKQAAAAASKLREQAGREADIEIQMLGRRHSHGVNLVNGGIGRADDAMVNLRLALNDAKGTIERTNDFADAFVMDVGEVRRAARDAASYERLATFELKARDILISIRDEARTQTSKLGQACVAADNAVGIPR